MTIKTTNFSIYKGQDSDDSETYLSTALALSLDNIDAALSAATPQLNVAPAGSQGCQGGAPTVVATLANVPIGQFLATGSVTVQDNSGLDNHTTCQVLDWNNNVVMTERITVRANGYATFSWARIWSAATLGTWTVTINPTSGTNPSVTAQANMIALNLVQLNKV